MADAASHRSVSIARLIFVPALISLAVTILRLVGELQYLSGRWFSTEYDETVIQGRLR